MATNQVYEFGDQFTVLETEVTSPADPASGDPVAVGQMPAVALTDVYEDTDGVEKITVKTNGVYEFPVTASNGAIAAGHIVHIHASTGVLSNTSGVRFGYALEAIDSAATAVIRVKIGY
jgi:predicted RecA/RadA family phage recombinase